MGVMCAHLAIMPVAAHGLYERERNTALIVLPGELHEVSAHQRRKRSPAPRDEQQHIRRTARASTRKHRSV